MENKYTPLVSIIIITYNSAEYVCDTLNSAINQTYRNIEIIITDDNSSDNTVDVCNKWITDHSSANIPMHLITTYKNTGTSGNCNRGLELANGDWIKVIAGDDILALDAIQNYVEYIKLHPSTKHLIANKILFKDTAELSNIQVQTKSSRYLFRDELSAKEQYYIITKMFFGSGPTYFVNTTLLRQLGGYDERFPLLEDYPLYIKMIGMGHKMEYMDKVTVYYRISETSVSHSKQQDSIFTKNQIRMIKEYKYLYRAERLNGLWKLFHIYSLWLQNVILNLGNSNKNPLCAFVKIIYSITDPFVLYAHYVQHKERVYLKHQ